MKDWIRNKSDEVAIEEGCYFDPKAGKHICDFFEMFLSVTTGRKAGEPLILLHWQRDFLSRLNGWKQADGSRRFSRVFMGISKKNGKTFMNSGLALYFGLADKESQPEIAMVASSREQANIMFREAKNMIKKSPAIRKMCRVVDSKKRIELPNASGYIAVLSSEASTAEGINASLVLCDETHVWYGTELYDALKYAGIARKQSLIIETTTAGSDKETFCFENWRYAKSVIEGHTIDTSLLPIIYDAKGLDPEDEATWKEANPSLGSVLTVKEFKTSMNKAKQSPIEWQTFLRYRLGIWVDSDEAWIDMVKWDECGGDPIDLGGELCFGGLDLASTADLCAFSLYFPEHKALLAWAWVPNAQVIKREEKNKASYLRFIEEGSLKKIEGDVADYDVIRYDINKLAEKYNIKAIANDPWGAQHLTTQLEQDGHDMAKFRQGFGSLSSPSKEFERLTLSGQLRHFNNKLLRWCVSNCAIEQDAAGNIKPSKKRSSEKIDCVVASVMAIGLAGVSEIKGPSIYEERGLLIL